MEEEWKDIKGYEELYQVSNLGRIKSLDRIIIMKNGIERKIKGRILIPTLDGKKNYLQVNLSKNNIHKTHLVHRLVGLSFVNGHEEGLDINHIDCDKTNNHYLNLRWVTRSQNMRNEKTYKKIIKHHKEIQSKAVIGVNKINGLILEFESGREAQRNGFKGIRENISGRCKQCKGFIWRYLNA